MAIDIKIKNNCNLNLTTDLPLDPFETNRDKLRGIMYILEYYIIDPEGSSMWFILMSELLTLEEYIYGYSQ